MDHSLTKQLLLANPEAAELREPFRLTFGKRPAEELYNLRTDPGEIDNVADEVKYTATKQELRARLDAWMRDTDDPRAHSDDDRWDQYPYYGNRAKPR